MIKEPSAAAELVRVNEPAVVAAMPRVGVAVQLEAVVDVVFGICPAAGVAVEFVPPPAIGIVGRSPVAMALNAPTPATAVACRTSVTVVSELAPTMYSVVIGNVKVTAPLGMGKFKVVRLVDVPVMIWLLVRP